MKKLKLIFRHFWFGNCFGYFSQNFEQSFFSEFSGHPIGKLLALSENNSMVEAGDGDKRPSLLLFRINYSCKMFYSSVHWT